MSGFIGEILLRGKMEVERMSYVLVPAREGGWVVKENNPQQYETGLLFAGDAEAVVVFLAQRLGVLEGIVAK